MSSITEQRGLLVDAAGLPALQFYLPGMPDIATPAYQTASVITWRWEPPPTPRPDVERKP